MADKDLTRIAALLRKAESTDNEHEADAYLQAAQRLATLSAVDLAVARSHTELRERRVRPTQRTITIGESGKRGLRTYVQLFLAIGRANNLTCDIARDSTRVYAYGFDTDIDTVQAMYASEARTICTTREAYSAWTVSMSVSNPYAYTRLESLAMSQVRLLARPMARNSWT